MPRVVGNEGVLVVPNTVAPSIHVYVGVNPIFAGVVLSVTDCPVQYVVPQPLIETFTGERDGTRGAVVTSFLNVVSEGVPDGLF